MKVNEANKFTLQGLVDYAVRKIVEQGKRCLDESGCSYGNENNHCVVGWLLDHDNKNMMKFKGGIVSLIHEFYEELPVLIRKESGLFELLQDFHDAPRKKERKEILGVMKGYYKNISFESPYFARWIEMGKEIKK